ncbi:MAG: hypothetical protein RL456_613 [Pseudomonadota bacterium]|jgi:hypothetical protein
MNTKTRAQTTPAPAPSPAAPYHAFEPAYMMPRGVCAPLPADRVLIGLEQIRDLAAGASVLVQMLERDELEGDFHDGQRLFSPVHRGDLMRLAAAASRTAAEVADELSDWAQRHHAAPSPGA